MAHNLPHNEGMSPEKMIVLAHELGIAQPVLANFVKILQHHAIPLEDYDFRLHTMARYYLKLLKELAHFQSEDPVTQALSSEAEQLLRQGDFDLVEDFIKQLKNKELVAARSRPEQIDKYLLSAAEVMARNGELKSIQLKYHEAAECFQKAAEIVPVQCAEQLVYYLNEAGNAWKNANQYSEAESSYLYGLVMVEKALGQDHAIVANVLSNLAELYQIQGRDDEAEPLYLRASQIRYKRSVAIFEQLLGTEHPTTKNAKDNLAALQPKNAR